jgi:hypothetical protein
MQSTASTPAPSVDTPQPSPFANLNSTTDAGQGRDLSLVILGANDEALESSPDIVTALRRCLSVASDVGSCAFRIQLGADRHLDSFEPLEVNGPHLSASSVSCILSVIQEEVSAGSFRPYAPGWITFRVTMLH